jgi:hypothetical protein
MKKHCVCKNKIKQEYLFDYLGIATSITLIAISLYKVHTGEW